MAPNLVGFLREQFGLGNECNYWTTIGRCRHFDALGLCIGTRCRAEQFGAPRVESTRHAPASEAHGSSACATHDLETVTPCASGSSLGAQRVGQLRRNRLAEHSWSHGSVVEFDTNLIRTNASAELAKFECDRSEWVGELERNSIAGNPGVDRTRIQCTGGNADLGRFSGKYSIEPGGVLWQGCSSESVVCS